MRLLILTQKININDDLLGFFHGWVVALARHCEKITVIALGVGEYNLPENVKVLSLGKERNSILSFPRKRESRIIDSGSGAGMTNNIFIKVKYIINFYKYIWRERKNYDSVFVHMNQEYVVLGGFIWWLLGKKIVLWRNHKVGGFWVRIAVFLSNIVFCTSQFAFVARYKKTKLMPVGINTDFFKLNSAIARTPNSVLFFGRLSPIKKPDVLIDALQLLKKDGINFEVSIVGDAPCRDKQYAEKLKQKVKEYNLTDCVKFEKGVPHWQAPEIYNQHEIFVNLTPSGSLDKMIFESMACGSLVLLSNHSLIGQIDQRLFFEENNPHDLAKKLTAIFSLSVSEKERILEGLRNFVIQKHSLDFLVKKILENL